MLNAFRLNDQEETVAGLKYGVGTGEDDGLAAEDRDDLGVLEGIAGGAGLNLFAHPGTIGAENAGGELGSVGEVERETGLEQGGEMEVGDFGGPGDVASLDETDGGLDLLGAVGRGVGAAGDLRLVEAAVLEQA